MRLLYISQHYPPETGAAQHRAKEHVKYLSELGYDIEVLTGIPNYPSGIVPPNYRGRVFLSEEIDGVSVHRCYLVPDTKKSKRVRLLNYATFCCSAIFRGLFVRRPSVILCTTPQLLVGLSGYILSRMHRSKLVVELRDLWVDSAKALGFLPLKLLLNLAKRLEGFILRQADLLVVVTDGYRRQLESNGYPSEKVVVVHNGFDTSTPIDQPIRATSRASLGINHESFVVLYAGNLGPAQDLDTLIHAANELRDEPFVFMVIGAGVSTKSLRELAKYPNVLFYQAIPYQELTVFYSAADACYVSLIRNPIFDVTIPSKLFDAMAHSIPVIMGAAGEAEQIVRSACCGITFRGTDVGSLVIALRQALENRAQLSAMGVNGRKFVEEHYSRKLLVNRLDDSLQRLLRRDEV